MDKKKIVIVVLILIIAILATFIAYQTLIHKEDNVINIENITFNTTNGTDFILYNQSTGWGQYVSGNGSGKYTVWIVDYDEVEYPSLYKAEMLQTKELPSQTIDGVVVYTDSAKLGKYVGEPRYCALIENMNINTDVKLYSPDPNETAKMALSLKFNQD